MAERNKIYKGKAWEKTREAVLKLDKGLCQRCLGVYKPKPGVQPRIKKAVLVHHHFPAKEYPQYKYSIYVKQGNQRIRNLYSLCFECHEEIEGRRGGKYSFRKKAQSDDFTTEERWD